MPLSRFPLIHTHSLDEAERLQSTVNAPVKGERLERRVPYEWKANRIEVGGLGIIASRYRAAIRGYAPNITRYSLLIALDAGGRSTQAGRGTPVVPGKIAVMASPGMASEFELGSSYRGIQVAIPAAMVSDAWSALSGRRAPAPLRFDPAVDLRAGGGADVLRLLRFLIAEAERAKNALMVPLVAGHLVNALAGALVSSLPHDQSHLLAWRVHPMEPDYVRRVEEYLAANAARPVSLADLVALVGVSGRAIQAGFKAHRGSSPMSFLRARRYELARRQLLASPDATITEVAFNCGFEHVGRFSAGYRARFGESPRATQRRAGRFAK